ncbi:MAG: RNA methyltransferase [Firmicutes bacterium]|nr:RNA methyltransferase [Bacillota bacterium]
MDIIASRQNPVFKELFKLKQRKYRLARGVFLAEGERLVRDALEAGWRPLQLIVTQGQEFDLGGSYVYITEQLMSALSETRSPQGVIGVFQHPGRRLEELAIKEGLVLVLDGLQDPGNAGTLLRSAAAAGVTGVIGLAGTVELTNPKVVRASMGGIFRTAWVEAVAREAFLDWARQQKLSLLQLEPRNGMPFHHYDYNHSPLGLVVGSETGGISAQVSAACSGALTIPMPGGSESLNAAMAATLVLWQALIARGL